MWKRIRHWWAAEGDLAKLQGVSNRMLEDMGLERETLRDRVHGNSVQPTERVCVAAGHLVRG